MESEFQKACLKQIWIFSDYFNICRIQAVILSCRVPLPAAAADVQKEPARKATEIIG